MRIVIAGAGDIGFHLAKLLSDEQQDIVLIDTNPDVLHFATTHLDVFSVQGDSASIRVLEQAEVSRASLFLAMTTSEKNNLVSSILAKKMGARQTVARVSNQEYLTEAQRVSFQELGVDSIICPTQLAAHEIDRLIRQTSVTDLFNFEQGTLTLAGIVVDSHSPLANRHISDFAKEENELMFRPIALLRGRSTILPRPDTQILKNDHIYFISNAKNMKKVLGKFGKNPMKVRNVMIIGGGELGLKASQMLEEDYNVVIVESDKEQCKQLAAKLNSSLIVNGDPNNIELLKEENLVNMDAFVAITPNAETNILTSLLAEELGTPKTIALVDNVEYTRISQNIGVDTIINKKLIAANNVFRFVRKGNIEAITSLHGVDAEIIEFVLEKQNRLTRNPLKSLHFPDEAVIAGIIRGEETLFPDGNTVLEKGDKVIVFAQHTAIPKVEKLFR